MLTDSKGRNACVLPARMRSKRMVLSTSTAIVAGALLFTLARPALAGIDAGRDGAGGPADDAGEDAGVPLACDGALCDTTNGAETGGSCAAGARMTTEGTLPALWGAGVLGFAMVRRGRRRFCGGEASK
jgi:hypothetical protein